MEQVPSSNKMEDLYANFLYVSKKFFKLNSLFSPEANASFYEHNWSMKNEGVYKQFDKWYF